MITLDAVATNPELARGVPRDVLVRTLMACALALMGEPRPSVAMERALAETLTTSEAARLVGIAPRTLARGARSTFKALTLPTGTRRLAWSRKAIEAWQQRPEFRAIEEERPAYPWLKR